MYSFRSLDLNWREYPFSDLGRGVTSRLRDPNIIEEYKKTGSPLSHASGHFVGGCEWGHVPGGDGHNCHEERM